ncbi:MAG: hypothetical protein Q4Q53_03120 [Methanocorpusculum sp.]|nr:hypothetical protein [Methanocorpusculum sp.]
MKKILSVFLALALCLICVSGVSAFQIEQEAVVNPSGVLGTGESVEASMVITFAAGAMEMGNDLILTTELVTPVWKTHVISGGHEITNRTNTNRVNTISGYLLGYQQKITLIINLTGSVSSASGGSSICVMNVKQEEYGTNELGEYSTPQQTVYNTADLSNDISAQNNKLSAVKHRISLYSGDFSKASQYAISAADALSKAESYGTADFRNAINALTEAEKNVNSADRAVTEKILALTKSNIDTVEGTISKLNSNGQTNEAALLTAANLGVKNAYNTALSSFNSGGNPDADTIYKESVSVLNIAYNYADLTPVSTQTTVKTATATQTISPTETKTSTASPTVSASPTSSNITISFPSLSNYYEQIILVCAVIILVLCAVIVINVAVIKRMRKKNGGKKGRKSEEL